MPTVDARTHLTTALSLEPAALAALTVMLDGEGHGSVISVPAGVDADVGVFAAMFEANTDISLFATAAAGSTYTGWSLPECSSTGPCTITLTDDTTITATFITTPAVTSVSIEPAATLLEVGATLQLSVTVGTNGGASDTVT